MLLTNLFHIVNGLSASEMELSEVKTAEYNVAFLRPSNSWRNLIVGYAKSDDIPPKYIFPKDTLFVSTNGEGSHTYSYVSPVEFIPNSDISVLIPKKEMGIKEKIFYAMCITKNRKKFSYGRKPKGERLGSIILPNNYSKWVNEVSIPDYTDINLNGDKKNKVNKTNLVPITSLFEISYGNKMDLNKMTIVDSKENGIAFVSRTARNLGIVSFVEEVDNIEPFPAGLLTVALGGSILSTFLQPYSFYTAQNVMVLKSLKSEMSDTEKLFYCMCIERNKFKYSAFGREANNTFKKLLVPCKVPKWVHAVDLQEYIDKTKF